MIAEMGSGTFSNSLLGGAGFLAMWQCTHSMGSDAVNGRAPVNISYSVTPRA